MLDDSSGPKLTANSDGGEILAHMTFYAENIARDPNEPCYDLSDGDGPENWINLNQVVELAAEELAGVPGRHPFGAQALDWWVEMLEIRGELAPE